MVLDGELNQLGGGSNFELLHDSVLVERHRARGDVENVPDFLHRVPFGDELHDFPLARRQLLRAVGRFGPLQHRSHQALRHQRGDVGPPPHHFADCGLELRGGRALEEVPGGTCPKRRRRKIRVLVHRQEDDAGVRKSLLDLARGVDAVQQRHRDVDDDDVRSQAVGSGEQGAAVGHHSHDVAVVVQ